MTPNLPLSLALFIPTKDHVEAEKALVAHVEQIVSSRVEEAKDCILRGVVAYLAGYELQPPPDEAPTASPQRTRIEPGERGEKHAQYVATFRSLYPNGERELANMLNAYPPGTVLTPAQHFQIKNHFQMGTRSLLLAPMLRELGCRENRSGRWITPILRISTTGGF